MNCLPEESRIMYTATTYPAVFQHNLVSSTMELHVPTKGYGRFVALVRTLRDGQSLASICRNIWPNWSRR